MYLCLKWIFVLFFLKINPPPPPPILVCTALNVSGKENMTNHIDYTYNRKHFFMNEWNSYCCLSCFSISQKTDLGARRESYLCRDAILKALTSCYNTERVNYEIPNRGNLKPSKMHFEDSH
jgi:hypothetical protein